MEAYRIKAYCKVNLSLDISGKREDGYHDIETLFQSINLYDTIDLEESEEFSINITEKSIPLNMQNTVTKAYMLFKEEFGKKAGLSHWKEFSLFVNKNVPIGAGMGGGSSDGAAVLRFLNTYYDEPFNKNEMEKMALSIGADTVFLLYGGTALGRGLGDVLEFSRFEEFDKYNVLIVYPNIHISTKWAYENVEKYLTNDKNLFKIKSLKIDFKEFIRSLKFSYNVFEPLVYNYYPRLQEIKDKIAKRRPVLSMMTGSGSAIYGIFSEELQIEQLKREFAGNIIFLAKPISQKVIQDEFQTKL